MFQLEFSKSVMLKVVRSFAQALLIIAALAARPAQAQTFTVLYSFSGAAAGDGATPLGPLALDSQANLYGTTIYGGTYNSGTVFKLDTTGHETVLYSFSNGDDGGNPTVAWPEIHRATCTAQPTPAASGVRARFSN